MVPPLRKPWCPTAQVPAPSNAYEAYDSVYELVEEEELEEPEEPEVRNIQRFRTFWTQKTPFSQRFGLIFKLGKRFFSNGVCDSITNSWASWGFNRTPKT